MFVESAPRYCLELAILVHQRLFNKLNLRRFFDGEYTDGEYRDLIKSGLRGE